MPSYFPFPFDSSFRQIFHFEFRFSIIQFIFSVDFLVLILFCVCERVCVVLSLSLSVLSCANRNSQLNHYCSIVKFPFVFHRLTSSIVCALVFPSVLLLWQVKKKRKENEIRRKRRQSSTSEANEMRRIVWIVCVLDDMWNRPRKKIVNLVGVSLKKNEYIFFHLNRLRYLYSVSCRFEVAIKNDKKETQSKSAFFCGAMKFVCLRFYVYFDCVGSTITK